MNLREHDKSWKALFSFGNRGFTPGLSQEKGLHLCETRGSTLMSKDIREQDGRPSCSLNLGCEHWKSIGLGRSSSMAKMHPKSEGSPLKTDFHKVKKIQKILNDAYLLLTYNAIISRIAQKMVSEIYLYLSGIN